MSEEFPEPDASLKAALRDELLRQQATPQLRRRVESLFDAPASTPISNRRRVWLAFAAAVLIGVGVSLLVVLQHDEDDEYLVAEKVLWPAMAQLHDEATSNSQMQLSEIAKIIGAPVASLPESEGRLISARASSFAQVPAAVLQYQVGDDRITLVCADAGKILTDTDEVEKYVEVVGQVQLAGGNRGKMWICALSGRSVAEAKLLSLLDRATVITQPQ